MIRSRALALAALGLTLPAFAATVVDTPDDFLPTYAGPLGADLDVLTTEAFLDNVNNTLSVTTTLGGSVGTTPGAFYVFGFNRGEGTERFVTGTPSIGAGVSFDLVLLLRPDGSAQVNDIVGGVNTPLPANSVLISGNTISSIALPLSLFPTRGFAATDYTFNLWPRVSTVVGNTAVSDFAPDASNAGLTVVPAPSVAGGLLAAGLFGTARRRNG